MSVRRDEGEIEGIIGLPDHIRVGYVGAHDNEEAGWVDTHVTVAFYIDEESFAVGFRPPLLADLIASLTLEGMQVFGRVAFQAVLDRATANVKDVTR